MSARVFPRRQSSRRPYGIAAAIVTVVAVVAIGWAVTLFTSPADSGSLAARTTAVGATVRCPICKYPIPLNDVGNAQAIQMRQFIHDRLAAGESEDQVRQDLAARYGANILLAPPQRGFDLLIWVVPLAALLACASLVLVAAWRWSRPSIAPMATPLAEPGPELRRYDEWLDGELAARE